MRVRIFYIQHTLSEAEELRVRDLRLNGSGSELGQVKVTYRKKRIIEEVEAESVPDAVQTVDAVKEEIEDIPGVYRHYRTVFGACEAQDAEYCRTLEGCFMAHEQELPL